MARGVVEAEWLDAHLAGAPGELKERTLEFLQAAEAAGRLPRRLAQAAEAALRRAISQPGDRSAALDLLAADALVTLALEAQAALDPAGLLAFARGLRDSEREVREGGTP